MNFTRLAGRRTGTGHASPPSHRRSILLDRRRIAPAGLSVIALALTACSGQSDGTSSSTATTTAERVTTSAADAVTSAATTATSVAEVDCDFEGVQLTVAPPTCYAVTVPEDWSNPDQDDPVVIQAAVFHATNPDNAANDPVIYLEGGPGLGTFSELQLLEPAVVEPFVATRDVILFDQRGTGQSTPSLECAGEETLEVPTPSSELSSPADTVMSDNTIDFDPTDPAVEAAATDAALAQIAECHRQLTDAGVNLAAYNSIASAHDVDAVRSGLGYDKVNVVGISYGTRLAQTYLRLFPDSIRSVIIDSVLPVAQTMFETEPVTFQQAIQNLFDRCRDDAGCNEAYPNFEADFWALIDRLNAEPVTIEQPLPDGNTWTMTTDGNAVIGIVRSSLYAKENFARLPEMVRQALAGNYELIGELESASSQFGGSFSMNTFNSVECNERVPFESAAQLEVNMPTEGAFGRLADFFVQSGNIFEICEVWPAGTAPAVENQPVVSEIPTLLLTGSFDPVTPPAFARSVAEHLANATVVEFPSEGHMVLHVECARDLARTFVDDPSQAPDTSCVEAVPPPRWVAN